MNSHNIDTSAKFGEGHLVRVTYNTEADGTHIHDVMGMPSIERPQTLHGPFDSEAEAEAWADARHEIEDPDTEDVVVIVFNRVRPVRGLTLENVKTFIYLTNFSCEFTDHVSVYALQQWGLGYGWWDQETNTIVASHRRGMNFKPYPLTPDESVFIAEDSPLSDADAEVNLSLGYSGLILTEDGPVKVFAPEWEVSYLGGTADAGEFGWLPDRDTALARARAAADRLTELIDLLGGIVHVIEDRDAGGENPHHLLQVLVPCDTILATYGGLPWWRDHLADALTGN